MASPISSLVAGVDGIPGGWIAAIAVPDGSSYLECFESFSSLLSRGFDLVLIDMPIGLPSAPSRKCDVEARRILGKRRNLVFPAPIREMLTAADYEAACAARQAVDGKRRSRQLFAILPRIKELDSSVIPPLQERVREGHPEVSFTMMNAGVPMSFHKSKAEGVSERLELLRPEFRDIDSRLLNLPRPPLRTDAIDA